MASDWQNKYFEEKFKNAEERDSQMMAALERNTRITQQVKVQAEKTNGRVTALEESDRAHKQAIKNLEKQKGKEFPVEPKTLSWLALALVLAMVIVATQLGIDVTPFWGGK